MITVNTVSHFPALAFADKASGKFSPVPPLTSQDIQRSLDQKIKEIAKERIEAIRHAKISIDDLDIFANELSDEITSLPEVATLFEAFTNSTDEETSSSIISSICSELPFQIRDELALKI